MRAEFDEFADVAAIAVHCENCGRRKRLGPDRVLRYSRDGIRTIERLGRRLFCSACREQGRASKNISLIPYLRPAPRSV